MNNKTVSSCWMYFSVGVLITVCFGVYLFPTTINVGDTYKDSANNPFLEHQTVTVLAVSNNYVQFVNDIGVTNAYVKSHFLDSYFKIK